MVDTGATHNFVSEAEAARLGLKLVGDDTGKMKAVNSKAMATVRAAKQVRVKLGTWEGTTDLIVVPMDDFDVVLGMEFLLEKSAIPVPATGSLLIMGDQPAVVQGRMRQPPEKKLLSALQFKKGLKRKEPSFIAVAAMFGDGGDEPIPLGIKVMLRGYADIMPDQLPKSLPPRRAVDHEIELFARVQATSKSPLQNGTPRVRRAEKAVERVVGGRIY